MEERETEREKKKSKIKAKYACIFHIQAIKHLNCQFLSKFVDFCQFHDVEMRPSQFNLYLKSEAERNGKMKLNKAKWNSQYVR